ncbi:MAG TPA: hypothetical protein H9676_01110 [Firmicutes bacterium]|nr:hypothetical protein [Bacillota bacterium]
MRGEEARERIRRIFENGPRLCYAPQKLDRLLGCIALRRPFFYEKPVRHRPKEAAQANIKNPRRKERRGIKDDRAVHRIAAWYIHGALFSSGGRSISGRYGIFFEKDLPELPLYDIMKKNFIIKRLQEEKLKWQIGLKKTPRDIGDSEN